MFDFEYDTAYEMSEKFIPVISRAILRDGRAAFDCYDCAITPCNDGYIVTMTNPIDDDIKIDDEWYHIEYTENLILYVTPDFKELFDYDIMIRDAVITDIDNTPW